MIPRRSLYHGHPPRAARPRLTAATPLSTTAARPVGASGSAAPPVPAVAAHAERAALIAILSLATLARVWEATRTPLWFDEIFTLWTARLGLHGTLELLRRDMHPPLFFVSVVGWRALGGESAVWLRMLPILFGVTTVVAVYALASHAMGRTAGLVAALLTALHRSMVFHSQELRSFAMLWCLQVIAVWAAWQWVQTGRRRDAVLYVAAGAAALYTHYLGGFVLAVIAAWALVPLWRTPRRLATWVGLHLAIALLFAPQVPVMLKQAAVNRMEHWIKPPHVMDLFDQGRQLAFGVSYLVPPLFALAFIPLVRRETRGAAALLWGVIAVPSLAGWIATRAGGHLYTVRYMLYGVPFFCALAAGGIVAIRRPRVVYALTVVFGLLAARALLLRPPFPEADQLRRASQWLAPRAHPGDVVYHTDTHSLLFFRHYQPDSAVHMLLLTQEHLPYYEGAELIPREWRVGPGALDAPRAPGAHWWAMRVRHGGQDGKQAATMLDERTGGPVIRWSLLSVWDGSKTP